MAVGQSEHPEPLADEWQFTGEAINEPDWDIWGSSPVITEDGKVHLFVARWPSKFPFRSAWRVHSQIAHYTADSPEGPFEFNKVVLEGDGKGWDAQGYHNPNIQKVEDRFALTCIANDGIGQHGPNQRIGIWVADRIDGPWSPAHGDPDKPVLAPPEDPAIWCHKSGCGVNNPALLPMSDGTFHLYFKAMAGKEGVTRMGLAVAEKLEGPYLIQPEPVTTNDRRIEDGYAFHWRGHVCLMTTDNHGMIEQGGGLLWVSRDGKKFEAPLPGFHRLDEHYFPAGVPETARQRYTPSVKCERPQILMVDNEPACLYAPCGVALDGSNGTNCYLFRRTPGAPSGNENSAETTLQTEWELIWKEDFAGTELDDSRWTPCKRGKPDWKNTMSEDPRLLKIENGVLHLRGIVNDMKDRDPAPYLTAGITSRGKFAFQYGKVQIRARFKSAQGAWPALWMLGAERGWPDNGEIDLMEHLNFDDIVYQTVHSEYTVKIDKSNMPRKGGTAEIKRDDWNTYGCEWDADRIVFFVNGKPAHTYPRVPAKGEKQWPFNQPFYFILSMQIGGQWVGKAEPAHYPAGMEVDWIRVHKRKQTLRLVSYNIRHGEGVDRKIDLERIAKVISGMNPDLVALQEVDRNCKRSGNADIARKLGENLGMEHRFGKFMDFQGGEYGMAILSRLPIIESNRHPLPEGAEPRCALEVKVRAEGYSQPISFVCVHNDWTSEEIRVKQVEALIKSLQANDHPVILAGDFNGERTDASIKLLESARWKILGNGAEMTWPSDEPSVEIDFFMVRDLPILTVEHYVIDEKVASDHRPIHAVIALQDK